MVLVVMSQAIHARFVETAREISDELADAIASTKPLHLVPNQESPFSERLCRAVAGQQLSVKAAATIWKRAIPRFEKILND
jgi:DNA-3-methyladenine glycosylase II